MKLLKLHIETFRHFNKTTIEFGNNLTVISGQNGTGKSSILGWIAQLCDFKGSTLRVDGGKFKEDFSNVFRFCPENDFIKNYSVKFEYKTDELIPSEKTIKTRFQEESATAKSRYRTDFDGRGIALNFPVIYLGLKRLIPLATEKKIDIQTTTLSVKDASIFSKLAKEILILTDDKINPEAIKSSNKELLAMKTDNYGHLGNSAGQDNIGQIISALISFEKLKEEQKENYNGGIILIDEIDATLYAGSQIKLIDILFKYSKILSLQIIFTTHSLEILEHINSKLGSETIVNYLKLDDGSIVNKLNPSFKYVSNKIKIQVGKQKEIIKTKIICEDKVAENWIKNMLNGSDLKQILLVEKGPFPDGTIVSMAESNHNIFKEVKFVLDADVKKKFIGKKIPPKTIFLPGIYRPETIMYNFIHSLSDSDIFWDDENNFTKQSCFGNYLDGNDKGVVKRWFNNQSNKPYFGSGYSKLFNRWKKENKLEVENFVNDLRKII